MGKPLTRQTIRVGLTVRRVGNPRTDVGRARKAQVFTIEKIYGDFTRHGYSRALLRGEGQAFWTSTPEQWERAPRRKKSDATQKGGE